MFQDVMVDLETLGQTPGCVILSIGAVAFDTDRMSLGEEFYDVVNTDDCLTRGLTTDQSTIDWWASQNSQAREVVEQAKIGGLLLEDSLVRFSDYLRRYSLRNVRVWGNGSDFDNAILACAYRACGMELPWKFWNNRCYRTMKSVKNAPSPKRVGTYHNALDDAKTQAQHMMEFMNARTG